MLKRTPLYATHQKLGARLIEFGGWEMPVQYSSIVDEHLAVRKSAGLFDISHMGEIGLTGPAAVDFLNHTLTNDARKLGIGQGQYTVFLSADHGVAHVPAFMKENKIPAGNFNEGAVLEQLNQQLKDKFGQGNLALAFSNYQLVLNNNLINEKKLKREDCCCTCL
jgi:hypothetical protein